jgi:hypothetical protein
VQIELSEFWRIEEHAHFAAVLAELEQDLAEDRVTRRLQDCNRFAARVVAADHDRE